MTTRQLSSLDEARATLAEYVRMGMEASRQRALGELRDRVGRTFGGETVTVQFAEEDGLESFTLEANDFEALVDELAAS